MVRSGLARDCPRFSGGRYAEAERQAAGGGATIGGVYPPARVLSAALRCAVTDQLIDRDAVIRQAAWGPVEGADVPIPPS